MTPQEITERYRRADAHERLALFLQHRDLREVFDAIDAEDDGTSSPDPMLKPQRANALRHRLGILEPG